jgi:hypothetical protein
LPIVCASGGACLSGAGTTAESNIVVRFVAPGLLQGYIGSLVIEKVG